LAPVLNGVIKAEHVLSLTRGYMIIGTPQASALCSGKLKVRTPMFKINVTLAKTETVEILLRTYLLNNRVLILKLLGYESNN
jgi:hypothetical protein